jgi:flagellar hook assembly protein FlgD
MGEQVRTLVNQLQGANYYTVRWDGNNDNGKQAANGVYFYKLISGDFSSTRKMMVLK